MHKDRRVSSADKQYDHQDGLFFNRQTTDFEPMALRLSDSERRRRPHSFVQSMKVLGVSK